MNSEQLKTKKRLAIYFFYDKDGKVDKYVVSFLRGLKQVATEILVVCNGKIDAGSRKALLSVATDILVRKNEGFDAWAFKEGLDFIGWDKLRTFYEIILCNFTVFGPVFPLAEMFNKMEENQDLDFWGVNLWSDKAGLTRGSEWAMSNPYGYLPDHIQSHFVVYRNKFTKTHDLKAYWDNLPKLNSYLDSVSKHESFFTQHFADKGFIYDTYIKECEASYGPYLLMDNPKKALQLGCPFFKRRSFFHDYAATLDFSAAEASIELLSYLRNDLKFNLDEVFENLIRTCHLIDLVRYLNLSFVLPTDKAPKEKSPLKTALVAHLYYEELLEDSFRYISQMPENSDIFLAVADSIRNESAKRVFSKLPHKVNYLYPENRGRDVSTLLVAAREQIKNYDLVCFYHDKKVTQLKPFSIGRSFAYTVNESILQNKNYVENVIEKFNQDKFLGLLSPLPPIHSLYFGLASGWTNNYQNTVELAQKLGLRVPMSRDKDPVAPLGTVFWFRPKALEDLLDIEWKYSDFPPEPNKIDGTLLHAIERLYTFCAQNRGFYVGYVMPDSIASQKLNQLSFYHNQMVLFSNRVGVYGSARTVYEKLDKFPQTCQVEASPLSTPNMGLKEAVKIYLNKKNQFLFKGTAQKIPAQLRNVGVREALLIWLQKRLNSSRKSG